MKPLLILSLALLLSNPLSAGETKKKATDDREKAVAETADSPLVAAAKRSSRRGKTPGYVITNETLKQQGGGARITTTEAQMPLISTPKKPATRPTPDMIHAEQRKRQQQAAEKAEAEKAEASSERQRRLALAAEMHQEGEGLVDEIEDDPAQAERRLEEEAARSGDPSPQPPN